MQKLFREAGSLLIIVLCCIRVTLDPKDEFFILGCDGIWVRQKARLEQFHHNGRHAAGARIVFSQIFACWLKIYQERNFMADFLPIIVAQWHTKMSCNGVEVDGCIGRTADRRVDDITTT